MSLWKVQKKVECLAMKLKYYICQMQDGKKICYAAFSRSQVVSVLSETGYIKKCLERFDSKKITMEVIFLDDGTV